MASINERRELQQQFSKAIAEWEAEDVVRGLHQRQGNMVAEQQSLDRMKKLGTLAIALQFKIGELLT